MCGGFGRPGFQVHMPMRPVLRHCSYSIGKVTRRLVSMRGAQNRSLKVTRGCGMGRRFIQRLFPCLTSNVLTMAGDRIAIPPPVRPAPSRPPPWEQDRRSQCERGRHRLPSPAPCSWHGHGSRHGRGGRRRFGRRPRASDFHGPQVRIFRLLLGESGAIRRSLPQGDAETRRRPVSCAAFGLAVSLTVSRQTPPSAGRIAPRSPAPRRRFAPRARDRRRRP